MSGLTATSVPAMPRWMLFLRGGIIIVCLGVLIASAYNLSIFDDYIIGFSSGPAGFLIFDVILTWLILGAMLASEFFFPQFYFRLAFIVLLLLDCVFWLSSWAWAARWAASLEALRRGTGSSADDVYNGYYGSLAAGAALGAFVWVALIVTVGFFTRACLRDGSGSGFNEAELGQRKPEDATQTPSQYPPQNQYQYPQQ